MKQWPRAQEQNKNYENARKEYETIQDEKDAANEKMINAGHDAITECTKIWENEKTKFQNILSSDGQSSTDKVSEAEKSKDLVSRVEKLNDTFRMVSAAWEKPASPHAIIRLLKKRSISQKSKTH